MEFYLVGGAVRDRLLGQVVKEKDYVVVGGSPERLLAQGFKPVGKDFPVFLHPKTREEYALARTERKESSGYRGFSVYYAPNVTLQEDLKRRDLTINAIAESETGEIIDPYGGVQDIERKVLRHVSPSFVEDPVRVLRVARFMARFAHFGFHIACETLELMRAMVHNKEVDALVPERIWREFKKALAEPNPLEFINTLEQCGAWRCICPEWTILTRDKHTQALKTLQAATELTQDTQVRFASLMQFIVPDNQDLNSAYRLTKRWRLPNVYRDLLILSIRYSQTANKANQLEAGALLDLLEQIDALRRSERFKQFLTVCEASECGQMTGKPVVYEPRLILLAAHKALQSIQPKSLLPLGLEGKAFYQKLRELRIQALKEVIAAYHH